MKKKSKPPVINPLLTPKWKQRTFDTHIIHQSKGDKRNFKYAFIGDSMMERWLTSGSDYWNTFLADHSINLGVGGDGVEHLLYRLTGDADKGIKPIFEFVTIEDTIYLMIGTNNLDRRSVDQIFEGIVNIINFISSQQPNTKIHLFGVTIRSDISNEKIDELNTKLAEYINMRGDQKLTFSDFNSKIYKDPKNFDDHVHLSSFGYETWMLHIKLLNTK